MVGVHIAGGAAEFGGVGAFQQLPALLGQAGGEHAEFLAKAGGGSRLPVGVGQHRDVLPLIFKAADYAADLVQQRQVNIRDALLQREGHAGVVDVLRGEAKVDEFAVAGVDAQGGKLLLDKVFHRLDVMVGGAFYLLDGLCIVYAKVEIDVAQRSEAAAVKATKLRQRYLAQGYEILYFYPYAIADQSIFGEIFSQFCSLGLIASVNGRHGGEWTKHIFAVSVRNEFQSY